MNIATSNRPAPDRAKAAAVGMGVAGATTMLGVILMGTSSPAGFPLTVAGLVLLYWQTHRYMTMKQLADAPDMTVAEAARPLPRLAGLSRAHLQAALAQRERSRYYLLRDGDTWRVVARRTLIDVLLSDVTSTPDPHIFGHAARWIDAETTVGRLRRLPAVGEVWLVRTAASRAPEGLTRALLDEAIESAPSAREAVVSAPVSHGTSRAAAARRAIAATPRTQIDLAEERQGAAV